MFFLSSSCQNGTYWEKSILLNTYNDSIKLLDWLLLTLLTKTSLLIGVQVLTETYLSLIVKLFTGKLSIAIISFTKKCIKFRLFTRKNLEVELKSK